MSESVTRPSRAPEAPMKKNASRQVTRAAQRRASSQVTSCRQIVSRCAAKVDAESRSFYVASVSDADALRVGRRFSARVVVAEWITLSTAIARSALAGRVTGYGAMRFHYAAELALEVAAQREQADGAPQPSANEPLGAAKVAPPVNVAALKRKVRRSLRNLGVEVARRPSSSASAAKVSHSLEDLAAAVTRAQKTIPSSVMADAGLTEAVIDALNDAALDAMSAHVEGIATRERALSAARREDVLLGRLVREMRLLVVSSQTAHRDDPEVPQLRCALFGAARKRAATKEPSRPADPPAPSPR